MALTVTLLGAPSVLRDGVPLTLTTRKTTALLAYLAVTGTAHGRDALTALFWPEADSPHARGALRYTLGQLRAAVGAERLVVAHDQVGLAAHDDLTIDVRQFDALITQVHAHGHALHQPCATCAPLLRAAVALQRGPLLAGFSLPDCPAFDDWHLFESERLQRDHADALRAVIDTYRAAGTPSDAIPYAQRWLALDTFADDANRVVIELLVASGQRSAARRHYDTHAKLLRDELDVEPASATTAVIAQLSAGERTDGALESSAPPAVVAAHALQSQPARALPTPATPLVGRAHEVAALGRLLDDPSCRVLTLHGPGGSGKTRLALAVAAERQTVATVPVVWIALASLDMPANLPAVIAAAVGCLLVPGDDPAQRLLDYLRPRHALLVLDNLEHLIQPADAGPDDAVRLVERILTDAPNVQLLLTSRARLQLSEERLYPVQGLAIPEWDDVSNAHTYAALELFCARARQQQPQFALTAESTPAVARIVRLVAGQPLAIELAAGWMGVFQPREIADELRRGIDVLATNARDVPARQRSMRASYAFSWQQLGPDARAVQQALSIFHGGFTREAAERVAGATAWSLRTLVDHALLGQHRTADATRYELHEMLRQFAAEQLAQAPDTLLAVRDRHAAYYLDWVVEQGMDRGSGAQHVPLSAELENMRAAWLWAVEQGDIDRLDRAITAVCTVFEQQGRTRDGMAMCAAVVERLAQPGAVAGGIRLLGRALTWQAAFAITSGQLDVAHDMLERSLALLSIPDAEAALAFALLTRGRLGLLAGQLADAAAWLARAEASYRSSGDQLGLAWTLSAQGRTAWLAGAYAQARQAHAESLAVFRSLRYRSGTAHALTELALLTVIAGETDAGLALLDESRRQFDAAGDQVAAVRVQRHVAATLFNLGRYHDARPLFEAGIGMHDLVGNRLAGVEDRLYLGLIHLLECQYDHVTRTATQALVISHELDHTRNAGFAEALLGLAELGRGAYLAARQHLEASLVTAHHTHLADDFSMTYWGLCQVERALGNRHLARTQALAALEVAGQGRGPRAAALAVSAWASVLADAGQVERAIELETVVLEQPLVDPTGFFAAYMVAAVATRSTQLPSERIQAARDRGRARVLAATVSDLLTAEREQVDETRPESTAGAAPRVTVSSS